MSCRLASSILLFDVLLSRSNSGCPVCPLPRASLKQLFSVGIACKSRFPTLSSCSAPNRYNGFASTNRIGREETEALYEKPTHWEIIKVTVTPLPHHSSDPRHQLIRQRLSPDIRQLVGWPIRGSGGARKLPWSRVQVPPG